MRMPSTLALAKKEQPKRPEESDEDYQDRMVEDVYWKLRKKKKRTTKEDEEYKSLQEKFIACYVVKKHGLCSTTTDTDLRLVALRLHKELSSQYGNMTPVKSLLIDRLVSAWSMAASYERMFQFTKYKIDTSGDDVKLTYSHNEKSIKLMQETRKGIESANDQIIRISQALRNLSTPPLHVKVKNAFIAQNQQINQATPLPKHNEKTFGGRV